MNQPMIIWCIIVGVLLFAFVLRAIERLNSCQPDNSKPHHRLFETAREREMFYIPGDIIPGNEEEDDEFDDL